MNIPAILFAGAAAICAVFTVWFAVEALLLASGQVPITWYIRDAVSWRPGLAMVVSLVIAILLAMGVTHFVVDVSAP